MPNLSNSSLSDEQTQFIEDIARLQIPWGMPLTSARIYAYLLLFSAPVTLDQMCDDLEISKSTASVAARTLENHLLAKRKTEKGSKRIYYVASENSSGLLSAKSHLLGEFGRILEARAPTVASGSTVQRMQALGKYYLSMQQALDTLLQETNANHFSSNTVPSKKTKQSSG